MIVEGRTVSAGVYAMRSVGNMLGTLYSIFLGHPLQTNYNEPGIGDGVFYRDSSTVEKVSLAGVSAGALFFIAGAVFINMELYETAVFTFISGFAAITVGGTYAALYRKHMETNRGIDIQPDGSTWLGYFNRNRKLEGDGIVLWPDGIAYNGIFEDGKIVKNNPIDKLILFPKDNKYTMDFIDIETSKKEDWEIGWYNLANTYCFHIINYDSVNKLLRFADGDVFRGVLSKNAEGIYIPKNGTVVGDTLRNVLFRKRIDEKEALGVKINSYESTCTCKMMIDRRKIPGMTRRVINKKPPQEQQKIYDDDDDDERFFLVEDYPTD
jgi:hypothetical protein